MSIVTIIGKLIALINQILGFSGTALPGYLVLKIKPDFVSRIVQFNKLNSIIITGTNGKTTTSRLIGDVLKINKIKFIHNRDGSNLIRGIASTLINQTNWLSKLSGNWAIWEIDEASVPEAVKQLQPKIILFNNLSRDQLDRYGEIDSLLKLWQQAIDNLPKKSLVLINRQDEHLLKLSHKNLIGFGKILPPDQYQQLNFLAAEAVCQILKLPEKSIQQAIMEFQPAFGRGETVIYQKQSIKIFLVKNPAGFNAVWQKLYQDKTIQQTLLIVLNDLIADGTDVSWIWDVDFNYLNKRNFPIIVSGTRAGDMGLRLKYAGLADKQLIIEPNLKKALAYQPKNILPTYTAMLNLRKIITHKKFN